MNKEEREDSRYEKVFEQMELLGIQDVTTNRQHQNGTRVWKLPIKNEWPGNRKNATYIEVASFDSGYVRNNNSGYSNYQLNKRCDSEPEYYKIERNGETLYRKFTTRTCKLIPIEIDRLEYLISYCLKNYYIKHANFVANGDYIPKWKFDNAISSSNNDFNGHRNRINDLESDVYTQRQRGDGYKKGYEHKKQYVRDLENKLDKAEKNEFYPHDLQVLVNGQRYKVI